MNGLIFCRIENSNTSDSGATRQHDVLILEIAIGLDRCLHNLAIAAEKA